MNRMFFLKVVDINAHFPPILGMILFDPRHADVLLLMKLTNCFTDRCFFRYVRLIFIKLNLNLHVSLKARYKRICQGLLCRDSVSRVRREHGFEQAKRLRVKKDLYLPSDLTYLSS
jgi:hypothetical protein